MESNWERMFRENSEADRQYAKLYERLSGMKCSVCQDQVDTNLMFDLNKAIEGSISFIVTEDICCNKFRNELTQIVKDGPKT